MNVGSCAPIVVGFTQIIQEFGEVLSAVVKFITVPTLPYQYTFTQTSNHVSELDKYQQTNLILRQ